MLKKNFKYGFMRTNINEDAFLFVCVFCSTQSGVYVFDNAALYHPAITTIEKPAPSYLQRKN